MPFTTEVLKEWHSCINSFIMEPLVDVVAEEYASIHTSKEDALLVKIKQETQQQHPHAHMLSGHVQGAFLSLISTMTKPEYILEIGCFTGYSAICLAKGLKENGALHTIEIRSEDALKARSYFDESDYKDKIHLHIGDAGTIIPDLPYVWDIVFIDADKTGYIEYYEMILPKLKTNGLIIADNVLFHGQVLGSEIKGKNARAIHEFNQYVLKDSRVEQVLLTVRDGLLIIRKL